MKYLLIFVLFLSENVFPQAYSSEFESLLKNYTSDDDTVYLGDICCQVGNLKNLQKTEAGAGIFNPPWTDGIIYYQFDSLITENDKEKFNKAASMWEDGTPLKFVQRTDQSNFIYLEYTKGNLAMSTLGMGKARQLLLIDRDFIIGILLHELGHAIGLHHEHQRSDRDLYLSVFPENIAHGFEGSIYLKMTTLNLTPYDFTSIMHYSKLAFSVNFKNTMEPKPEYSSFLNIMGQRTKISKLDKEGVRKLYSFIPELIFPENKFSYAPKNRIELLWKAFWGAEKFNYQISTDHGFNNVVINGFKKAGKERNNYMAYEEYSTYVDGLLPNTDYYWRVRTITKLNTYEWSSVRQFKTTDYNYTYEKRDDLIDYKITQNYPNPFSEKTNIVVENISSQYLDLSVYDIKGSLVKILLSGSFPPGVFNIIWDASEAASGVYIYKLTTPRKSESHKMILMR